MPWQHSITRGYFQNILYFFFLKRIRKGLNFGSDAEGGWSLTVVMLPDPSKDRALVIYDWGYTEETLGAWQISTNHCDQLMKMHGVKYMKIFAGVWQTGSISKFIANLVGKELRRTFPSSVSPGLEHHNLESRYLFFCKSTSNPCRSSNEDVLMSQNDFMWRIPVAGNVVWIQSQG